jgi:hypothetical protein
MLYRLITSGYTDTLAYITALVTALWMFAARQYAAELPGFLVAVPPEYGIAVSAFCGALLIGKYIFLDGTAETISQLESEKQRLEKIIITRDLTAAEQKRKAAALDAEISMLRNRIVVLEENAPDKQLSALRKKLRATEDDKKAALTVLLKSLQARLAMMREVHDPQLLFAANVLSQEVELVENELKRGERSYYELCLKIVDISDNLSELKDIELAATFDQTHSGNVADTWLNFIRVNDNSDPAAVERAFKFFKVAFHPDKFTSESQKVEATRYFQQSINAHNSLSHKGNAA